MTIKPSYNCAVEFAHYWIHVQAETKEEALEKAKIVALQIIENKSAENVTPTGTVVFEDGRTC